MGIDFMGVDFTDLGFVGIDHVCPAQKSGRPRTRQAEGPPLGCELARARRALSVPGILSGASVGLQGASALRRTRCG